MSLFAAVMVLAMGAQDAAPKELQKLENLAYLAPAQTQAEPPLSSPNHLSAAETKPDPNAASLSLQVKRTLTLIAIGTEILVTRALVANDPKKILALNKQMVELTPNLWKAARILQASSREFNSVLLQWAGWNQGVKPTWQTAVPIFAAAAAGEELIFRKLLQSYLGRKMLIDLCKRWKISSAWVDSWPIRAIRVAVVAYLFAIVHAKPEKWGGPKVVSKGSTQLVAGLVYGTLQEATGDTRYSIFAHAIANLFPHFWSEAYATKDVQDSFMAALRQAQAAAAAAPAAP